MAIFEAIAGIGKAIAGIFGYAAQRDAEKNAPAMQANAAAEVREGIKAEAAKEVAAEETDAIQKGLAE